jgi:hypothetical protein
VTDEVIEEVKTWQERQLDEVYPIMYLDAIKFKVRDGGPRKKQSDLPGHRDHAHGNEGSAGVADRADVWQRRVLRSKHDRIPSYIGKQSSRW